MNTRHALLPVRRILLTVCLLPACLGLTACDLLGEEAEARAAAARDAEGRAIGSACRHAGRSLEDCYTQNPRAIKASVFAGWRDMDGYMRENNIAIIPPPEYRSLPETAALNAQATQDPQNAPQATGEAPAAASPPPPP